MTSAQGHGLLAASYDKSALLWQRGSAAPKVKHPSPCDASSSPRDNDRETVCQLTLTGHSRKVTAARFCTLPHQAATGSADRSIRHWDLHRAACQSPAEGSGLGSGFSSPLTLLLSRCAAGPGDVLLQRPGLCRPPDHQRTLRLQGPRLGQQVTFTC